MAPKVRNPEEYIIVDSLYSKIETAMSDKNNVRKLLRAIASYADRNSNILLSTNLSTRLLFTESDKDIVFRLCDISKKDIENAIRSSKTIKSTWRKATNPFYILCILLIRYFIINKMDAEKEAVSTYLGYLLYTSAHKSSFNYLPNKEIMDYTINNLSNRFYLKQSGTIQGMIEQTILNAIDGLYNEKFIDCKDQDIADIVSGLDVRISSSLKYIADKFYENHSKGKYLFHEDDNLSEDDFHLSDNISFKIDRLTNIVSTSIVSEGFDQNTCIKRAINLNPGVSAKKLEPMLLTIVTEDMQSISKVVSSILTLFVYKGISNSIDDVRTMKFVSESMQIYKSNAQDEITTSLKNKLAEWIDLTSEKYGRNFISRGKSSLDSYKRAIYTAFVFKIMECAKA